MSRRGHFGVSLLFVRQVLYKDSEIIVHYNVQDAEVAGRVYVAAMEIAEKGDRHNGW